MAGGGVIGAGRVIVVTGCDEHHFHLAADTLASLRDLGPAGFDIGFVHVGPADLPGEMAAAADKVARVDDAEYRARPRQGFALAYLGVKARLPEFFPGYDVYVWLDGDTWVQNVVGIATLVEAAKTGDIGAHLESDINYARTPHPDYRSISIYYSLFPELDAGSFNRYPMLNGGVFAATASSPLWAKWGGLLAAIRERDAARPNQFYSDHIPLHYLSVMGEVRATPVSSLNNWQLYTALPTFNLARGLLLSPFPPYYEINILHLAGVTKDSRFQIGPSGETATFRYRDVRVLLGKAKVR